MQPKWCVLALLWLALFTAYLDRVNITIAGPTLMRELGLDAQGFGYVLAAFTAGYALMQIPGGLLADRFGSRRLMVVALVLWSLFTGVTGLAASLGALIGIRFAFGFGEGLENGAHFKALADFFEVGDRAFGSGVLHTSIALGPAVVAPIAALLIARVGWQTTFALFTIPGLAVAFLVWRFMPTSPADPRPRSERAGLSAVLRSPTAWSPFAAYALFNVAFWGLLGFMPTYLTLTRHIELKALGWISSIPYACGLVGLLLVGRLATAFAARRAIIIAALYVGAACGLFATIHAGGIVATVAALSATAFFAYASFGPFWAVALDIVPADVRGAFSGFVNFGGQAGGFAAPIVVGALVKRTGSFDAGFAVMMGALILGAVCMFVIAETAARRERAAGQLVS